MLKLTGRTAHQIQALKNESVVVHNETNTTCEVAGFASWDELHQALSMTRRASLDCNKQTYGATINERFSGADRTAARKGHFTALGSVLRYTAKQADAETARKNEPVTIVVSDTRPKIDKATEAKVARERKAQEKRDAKKAARKNGQGPACQCNCGGTTGGGKFLPGHDAKHKSNLIKRALAQQSDVPSAAHLELEERGWTKFLDKAREVAGRPKAEVRERKSEDDELRAREKIARLNLLKDAGDVLRAKGHYGVSAGANRVALTRENAQAIVDGTFDYDDYFAGEQLRMEEA